ncbi:hypothetical protein M378DRAFT_41812, partial [Amanita muscaria Koide BX008]
NQMDLVTSFDCLLDKVAILVKIGDEVAKIHPYVNFAWQVLSAGLKIVKAQQDRDQKISGLVRTMENLYSFVALTDELAENHVLQDIIEQILKQTIECGFFIQEYSRRNFGGRAIVQLFSDADDRIAGFCAAFARLRGNFDSRVNLNTALVLSQTASTIDAIRHDQVLSALKPVAINEYNRDPCLPKTRLDVVKFFVEWIADGPSDQKGVLWLYGLAGSGKSTLSTTIAWMMREFRRLGAFFFFDRDIPKRNAATMIPVLAYQLAQIDARIGAIVSQIVERNPNIAEMPINVQFATLLSAKALQSVEWSGGPIVLVIDALDECGIEKDRAKLLDALSIGFSDLPPFLRVIVVSRPETDIKRKFASHPAVYPYHLDIDSAANKDDISEFLRHRLNKIRTNNEYLHFTSDWPGEDKINALTERSAGLFVWASTASLYIDGHAPDLRLNELIIQQSVDTSSEPFVNLDRLYKTGLQSAGRWADTLFRSDCCAIFGAIICARNPLTCLMIDSLLSLQEPCLQSISRLGCVLRWSETEPIRILHPSFHDYLSGRCHGEPWFIDLEEHNAKLAVHCIKLLDSDNGLRENICGLTLPHPVQNETLPEAVSYACKFWTIRVWDANTGVEMLPPLRGHDNWVRSVAFSHDGSKIVSGSTDKTIRVWNANTGVEMLPPLRGHDDSVIFVAFSHDADGSKIVSGSEDKTIRVWDANTGVEMLPPLQGHDDLVRSVAFSHDGSKIVSGSDDRTIRVWNANTGVEMLPPLQGHRNYVTSVAFSHDGSKIVSGSTDMTIRVWDAEIPPLPGHDDLVRSVAFSHDGSKIVSGFDEETIQVWDANTGVKMLPPLRGHDDWVTSVAFSHDGSKIVSGSLDKTIRVWNANTGVEMLPPLRGHDDSVIFVAFSHDGSKIVSGSDNMTIGVWDANTGVEMLPPLRGHDSWVTSVAFSHDGSKIVSGSADKTIRVWNANTGVEMLPPLRGHDDSVTFVAFSHNGSKIVSVSDDMTIRVWDANTGVEMLPPLRGHDNWVTSVAFSHDGSKIVSRSSDKTIRVWDANTGV